MKVRETDFRADIEIESLRIKSGYDYRGYSLRLSSVEKQ